MRLAPAPVPVDVGIVVAVAMEVAPLLERLKNVRKYAPKGCTIIEGELAGKLVAIVLTGMGRARAQRGAMRLIDGHRPRTLLSAGFAGALDTSLTQHSVLMPTEIANVEGRLFPIEWPETQAIPGGIVRKGRLLTTDAIVLKAADKAALREAHKADLVDMETSAVAAYCAERGVRFVPLRIVSDDANVDLPPEILSIVGDSGSYRIGAAIGAIWRRPSCLKDLLALREQAIESAKKLTNAVISLLPIL